MSSKKTAQSRTSRKLADAVKAFSRSPKTVRVRVLKKAVVASRGTKRTK